MQQLNKGFFVLAGPVGAGKSTEAQNAFGRDAITISTDPNVLRYPRQRFVRGKTTVFTKRELLVTPFGIDIVDQQGNVLSSTREITPDGAAIVKDYRAQFEDAAFNVLKKCAAEHAAKQPLTYKNVIVDEAAQALTWAFAALRDGGAGTTRANNVDLRRVYTLTHDWMVTILTQLMQVRVYGANLVFITHEQEPEEKKRGGAAFLSQQVAKSINKMCDGILLRRIVREKTVAEDGVKTTETVERQWQVFADPDWDVKLRGLDEEEFEACKKKPLKEIIQMAGFEP